MIELNRKFLRCLIKSTEDEELKDNFFKLENKNINLNPSPVCKELLQFVQDYYQDYSDYPTFKVMGSNFEEQSNFDAIDELKAADAALREARMI